MKVDPDDFPPSVPAETVARIVALQDARDRLPWWWIVGMVASVIAAISLVIAADILEWPSWVPGLGMIYFGVMTVVAQITSGRKMHRVLVEQGFTCPKCHGAMFTDTWSMKKQETERDSLFAGRCPRCFEPVDQIVMAPADSPPPPKLDSELRRR